MLRAAKDAALRNVPLQGGSPTIGPAHRPLPRDLVEDQPLIHTALGPCRVIGWREMTVDGRSERVLVLAFESAGMTLTIPEVKVPRSPLRALASPEELARALDILLQQPQPTRGSWQHSMNSYLIRLRDGRPEVLAAILRDLSICKGAWCTRIRDQALARLSGELAIVNRVTIEEAGATIVALLPAAA